MRRLLLLLTMVALLTSCSYQDCHTVNMANSDNITVEEALSHYNTHCADKYTRSNIDERLPFVLGDAEWLWDSAEGSSYDDKSAIDIPLSGGYQYVVYRKQADGTYYSVHTSSKVVAVQDDTTGNISFYIRVSIPDSDGANSSTESLNYEQRASFSGLEYYITIDGCPAAIVKFENGEQTDGVFLGDESIDDVARIGKLAELLDGLCIGKAYNTRSNDDMQYGQPNETFQDQWGSLYVYQDVYPKDGKSESVTQIFPDDIAYTIYFGTTNVGNSGSPNTFGGVINAGSMTTGVGGLGAGGTTPSTGVAGGVVSGGNGGSTTTTNNNSNNSDVQLPIIEIFKDKDFVDPTILINKITIDNLTWDGTTDISKELLSPTEANALLLERLSPTNPIWELVNSSTIPIYPSSVVPDQIIGSLAADLKGKTIYYNEGYYNTLTNTGRLLSIFHEYMHLYLNSRDHNLMIDSLEYQQGLRDLFPDMPVLFYEVAQYIGMEKLFKDAFSDLDSDSFRKINNYKKKIIFIQ